MKEHAYKYYLPGIVKTGHAQNQVLHLDSMNPDYDDPYSELIVHIPMEQEGQWLRTGKEVLNEDGEVVKLIHKMIHIPFGSGVLLPMTQLHAGHYGVFANTRFHCIISTKENYVGSHLFLTNVYLTKRYEAKNSSDILTQWELEVHSTITKEQIQLAVGRIKSRIGQLYRRQLIKRYGWPTFLGYLASYEQNT